MRSIWSGSLSFGLLNIPVNLFSASKERALSFHLFDRHDNCPISYKKVCKNDGHAVDAKDIVKGYEYEKGQFVMLEKSDFKKANAKKTGSIEIISFADVKNLDERYYDKPYFILPDEKSAKAYILLRDAMTKTKKAGVARFVLREKEHIALVKINSHILTLIQLRFDDELKNPADFNLPKTTYTKKELDMAVTLIKSLNEPFKPAKYKDTYAQEIMKIIEAKAKGKKIESISRAPVPTPLDTDSILKLLEKSMRNNDR